MERGWSPVCGDMKKHEAASICQQLSCGPLSATGYLAMDSNREARVQAMRCTWMGTWERCHWLPANCSNHATFICSGEHHATLPQPPCAPAASTVASLLVSEPAPTTTKPPTMPPTTSPEPTGESPAARAAWQGFAWLLGNLGSPNPACDGRDLPVPSPGPPRLRLVDGYFSCSGFVELHMRGRWGAVASNPGNWMELGARICSTLGCGSLIDGPTAPQPSQLLVKWEAVEPCRSPQPFDCFNRTRAERGRAPAFLTCSGERRTGGCCGGGAVDTAPFWHAGGGHGELGAPLGGSGAPSTPHAAVHPLPLCLFRA